jgi:oxygen-independent coproporphyrinogen-3 oxidase
MLALYIHIPYCVRKCPYCGFYSTPYTPTDADAFITTLRREAAGYHDEFSNRIFNTVYIGGGTPTVLSSEQITSVLDIVHEHFRISEQAEFTVEANPNSVTMRTLSMLLERGVNRLSLGVQSFSDEDLTVLGRPHTADHAAEAFLLARKAGFQNIGMDFMYGIPGQTMSRWEATLERAIEYRPEHISVYGLSIDDGSLFRREADAGRFALPDDDRAADMYEYAVTTLIGAGYGRYEISNFALTGFECRHNMNYWDRGEYLGLGPGASSFHSNKRYHTIADTKEYARRIHSGESTAVDVEFPGLEQASREAILLNLRTAKGMDLYRYEKEFGARLFAQLERNMNPLLREGLLLISEGSVRLTDRGILLSNEALSRLFA